MPALPTCCLSLTSPLYGMKHSVLLLVLVGLAVMGCAAPPATPVPAPPSAATQATPPFPNTASWAERVRTTVRRNIVLAEDVPGNPLAEVDVWLGPQGQILRMELVKSSGIEAWDRAVMKGLSRTERLPLDADGRVPPRVRLAFRPRSV